MDQQYQTINDVGLSQSNQRELYDSNNSSKIWSQIASSRVQEVRQVIIINEEKFSKDVNQTANSSPEIQRNIANKPLEITNNQVQIQTNQKKTPSMIPRDKEQYLSKDLFPSSSLSPKLFAQYEQNKRMYQEFSQKYLKDTNSKPIEFHHVQKNALDVIIDFSKSSKGYNWIKIVDLLYKKYLLKPKKDQLNINAPDFKPFNIYQLEPVFAQKFTPYKDSNTKNSTLDNSQDSQTNSFKRNYSGNKFGEDNQISLIQNETASEVTDLEVIASNYVDTIRKIKRVDGQKPTFFNAPKPMIQRLKNLPVQFSPPPIAPLQVKMPINAVVGRQFQPHNVLQSTDEQKSQRFNQERLIAKTFVKDGYGLQIVRNYLGPSIQGGSYNRAVTTIIRQSYKKIEQFLSKQCNIKIHNLTSSQFSLVKTPLVHCRNILRPEDLRTFFKFIAITYNFGKLRQTEYPTAQEALNLYNAILRGLSDRKSAKQGVIKNGVANGKQSYFEKMNKKF